MKKNTSEIDQLVYAINYIVPPITGILVYILYAKKDKRLKMHSLQSIGLGAAIIIVSAFFGFVLLGFLGASINLLIWIYCLYLGIEAYRGNDIEVPILYPYIKDL